LFQSIVLVRGGAGFIPQYRPMPPTASKRRYLVIVVCELDGQDHSKQRNDELLGLVLHVSFQTEMRHQNASPDRYWETLLKLFKDTSKNVVF
jgi:hypothetical protein